jgi:uncharacterized protein (DUF1800 family)
MSMNPFLRAGAVFFAGVTTCLGAGALGAQENGIPNDRDEIIHVLNRTTFGPRPGDVEAVQKMGLAAYLQQQLHPETIDDSAVDQAVAQMPYMESTSAELVALNHKWDKERQQRVTEAMKKAAAQGQNSLTEAEAKGEPMDGPLPTDPVARRAEELRRAERFTPNTPADELTQAKLLRAIDSKRQLQEVLVDFWSNHFNIDRTKGDTRLYLISYDRDVIRPNILGRFRDLLEATAKSPAMLLYLDNATNVVPQKPPAFDPKHPHAAEKLAKLGGFNENYGREIMELHTLGVDAGYTQKDVQEVARCFTGWTLDKPTGNFVFHPELHDNGEKVVLGHVIPAGGGLQDGETVMDILCSTPQCAHFIAKEMCERFVSDTPPAALVDRIAGVFQQTQGDLRQVTQAILTSPEFLASSSFGNKIKSPEEFAISAVRASGATLLPSLHPNLVAMTDGAGQPEEHHHHHHEDTNVPRGSLRGDISNLGEPLYHCVPPTGWKEISTTWVGPSELIGRINFAVALTEQSVNDVRFDTGKILGGVDLDQPDAVLNQCVAVLLQNKISDSTRKVLAETAVPPPGEAKTVNPTKLIALILGSPEFQRK